MMGALVAFTFVPATHAQSGTWTTIAPLPIAVSYGSNGVAFDGKFCVFDGTNGTSQAPQFYDPVTNIWSVKAADPVVRSESAAGVIGNKIYVAEGWLNSNSNTPSTTLTIYDPFTDSWRRGGLQPRGSRPVGGRGD